MTSMSEADVLQSEIEETPIDKLLLSEARLLADSHKQHTLDSSSETVRDTVRQNVAIARRECLLREAWIQSLAREALESNSSSQAKAHSLGSAAEEDEIVVVSVSTKEDDISLHRLNNIRQARSNGVTRVRMSVIDRIPTYDAWVPVIQNHFVDDSDVEPYHPNFGESKRMKELAAEVFEQMLIDRSIGPFDEVSDGELKTDGRPVAPETLEEMEAFYELESLRTRAAQRQSILKVTRRHGKTRPVWKALSVAFDISDIRRLRYICDLSERREAETQRRLARRQRSRAQSRSIQRSISILRADKDAVLEDINRTVRGPLRHFCFACHEFACHLHEGENVAPVLPIPDHAAEARMIERSRGATGASSKGPAPCSQSCFLLESWDQGPVEMREGEPWVSDQVLLLRQAATMFGKDPCRLSVVMNDKTCREVHARLQLPEEATVTAAALRLSKMPRAMTASSDSDEDEPLVRRRRKRGSRGRAGKSVSAKKSTPRVSEYGTSRDKEVRKRFIPCDHVGGCFKRNGCICAINEVSCETQCGCNCGRYVEGTWGMKWETPSEIELRTGLAAKCKLRSWGCSCKVGHCNTPRCECYAKLRACNPDFCNNCDCNALPSQTSVRRRRCRSAGTITSRHKRTYIGRSAVHGYGLFAGEVFRVGDLVGQYSGRVMDPELADKSLRCSQAKKKTYAFELMDTLTVDGGFVGSKVKFINHSADETSINCGARIERVRGDGRIVLRALKPVYPGDEFLFNYNILDDEGNDWMIHKEAERGEVEGDTDEDSDFDSGWYSDSVGADEMDEVPKAEEEPNTLAPEGIKKELISE